MLWLVAPAQTTPCDNGYHCSARLSQHGDASSLQQLTRWFQLHTSSNGHCKRCALTSAAITDGQPSSHDGAVDTAALSTPLATVFRLWSLRTPDNIYFTMDGVGQVQATRPIANHHSTALQRADVSAGVQHGRVHMASSDSEDSDGSAGTSPTPPELWLPEWRKGTVRDHCAAALLEGWLDRGVDAALESPLWTGQGLPLPHKAALLGHVNVLLVMFEFGVHLDEIIVCSELDQDCVGDAGLDGATPLHVAAVFGQYEAMLVLFDCEVDIDAPASSGLTPLAMAVDHGDDMACSLLLDYGADPLFRYPDDDTTLLMRASLRGSIEVAMDLLRAGCDVNERTDSGQTAVMAALGEGHNGMVNALLAKGANPNVIGECGRTPLMLACHVRDMPTVRMLVSAGADVNQQCASLRTAVFHAAQVGDLAILDYLVTRGADLHVEDIARSRPMDVAARHGYPECACYLAEKTSASFLGRLEEQAAVNFHGTMQGAFVIAAETGRADTCLSLLKYGAKISVNGKIPFKPPALVAAAQQGRAEVVRLLLLFGADVNLTSNGASRAIIAAAEAGSAETLEALFDAPIRGVDEGLPHTDPSIVLQRRGFEDSLTAVLHAAVRAPTTAAVSFLLARGANANALHNGQTAGHVAVSWGAEEALQVLYSDGQADPCAVNHVGATWAHVAAGLGFHDLVARILGFDERGRRSALMKRNDGRTLVDCCLRGNSPRTLRAVWTAMGPAHVVSHQTIPVRDKNPCNLPAWMIHDKPRQQLLDMLQRARDELARGPALTLRALVMSGRAVSSGRVVGGEESGGEGVQDHRDSAGNG